MQWSAQAVRGLWAAVLVLGAVTGVQQRSESLQPTETKEFRIKFKDPAYNSVHSPAQSSAQSPALNTALNPALSPALNPALSAAHQSPPCPTGCATCSPFNGCLTCQSSHKLLLQWHGMRQMGVCVNTCPASYYVVRKRDHGKCNKCQVSQCATCLNATRCLACLAPYFTHEGQCVEACPESAPLVSQLTRECLVQVDCAVNAWSFWSRCSRKNASCGYRTGHQTRSRDVLEGPSPGGRACPPTLQRRKCRMKYPVCEDMLKRDYDFSRVTIKLDPQQRRARILKNPTVENRRRLQRPDRRRNRIEAELDSERVRDRRVHRVRPEADGPKEGILLETEVQAGQPDQILLDGVREQLYLDTLPDTHPDQILSFGSLHDVRPVWVLSDTPEAGQRKKRVRTGNINAVRPPRQVGDETRGRKKNKKKKKEQLVVLVTEPV